MGAEYANSVAGSVLSGGMISMAETQGDIYVRKDVFDARMDRLEMMLEKTTVEIKSYVDKSMAEIRTYVDKSTGETKSYVEKAVGEIKAEIGEVRNDVRVLTARVDTLEQTLGARIGAVENTLSWWIALFAAFIAITAFISPVLAFFKKLFQPSVTLEDVQRLIDTAIENHLSGGKTE